MEGWSRGLAQRQLIARAVEAAGRWRLESRACGTHLQQSGNRVTKYRQSAGCSPCQQHVRIMSSVPSAASEGRAGVARPGRDRRSAPARAGGLAGRPAAQPGKRRRTAPTRTSCGATSTVSAGLFGGKKPIRGGRDGPAMVGDAAAARASSPMKSAGIGIGLVGGAAADLAFGSGFFLSSRGGPAGRRDPFNRL